MNDMPDILIWIYIHVHNTHHGQCTTWNTPDGLLPQQLTEQWYKQLCIDQQSMKRAC